MRSPEGIQLIRKIRNELYEETKNMSIEERREKTRQEAKIVQQRIDELRAKKREKLLIR